MDFIYYGPIAWLALRLRRDSGSPLSVGTYISKHHISAGLGLADLSLSEPGCFICLGGRLVGPGISPLRLSPKN